MERAVPCTAVVPLTAWASRESRHCIAAPGSCAPAPLRSAVIRLATCVCPHASHRQVTGSVSSKTSFLLVGSHAGRSKYFHAKEKQVGVGAW